MMMRNDKRGVAVFVVVIFVVLALLGLYLVLHLPIPSFTKVRSLIDYIMVIVIWLVLQVGIVYGYYRAGILVKKGWFIYKSKIMLGTLKVKNFLIGRG